MEIRSSDVRLLAILAALATATLHGVPLAQPAGPREAIRRTLAFQNAEREYFVQLPPKFERGRSYWPLVVVHGAGGNGRTFFMAAGISRVVAEIGLDAVVISPSFRNDADNASRFPALGEGAFLEEVLRDLRRDYTLGPKMLLTGYSRGGQFAHRYALAHPDQVEAVAPFASGTWTTPDGRLLVEAIGEVRDARTFLSNPANASAVPARLADLFDPRVAAAAATRAAAGAQDIPFLVMCGTLDPRLSIAREFVSSLQALRYTVAVEWPRTPHGCSTDSCRAEYDAEFQKYSRAAVEFFQRVARRK